MITAYIQVDELAANALIIAGKYGRRFVSYKVMEDYGLRVTKILHDKGISAVLLLSRNRTQDMLQTKSELFEEQTVDGKTGIALREGKTVKDLIWKYHGYFPLTFLLAFQDCRATSVLEDC